MMPRDCLAVSETARRRACQLWVLANIPRG